MTGVQYVYKIAYSDITNYFLLPKLDGGRSAFVIALEKPIRQGQQKHQYLVLETNKLQATVSLNLSEEEVQREYKGELNKENTGPDHCATSSLRYKLTLFCFIYFIKKYLSYF
jgi:structure-specific recognition protein 1